MFALRSSPSSLVCDLRNTLLPAAEGGFQLSAPRPRRASVRLGFDIYYAGGADGHYSGEADGGTSSGSSAFSPTVSDYAGVFEAGDPARARESMNSFGAAAAAGARPTTGLVEEQAPRHDDLGGNRRQGSRLAAGTEERRRSSAGVDGVVARDDHEESSPEEEGGLEEDFLFEMEGLKDEERGMRVSNGGSRTTGGGREGGGGESEGWGASAIAGATAAAAAAAAAAASNRGAGSRGEVVGGGAAAPGNFNFHRTPTTYASLSPSCAGSSYAGGEKQQQQCVGTASMATGAAGVGGGGTALRKPRVIAPRGTRCIGGGMYRLRLSTSC
eukprot:g15336.t1